MTRWSDVRPAEPEARATALAAHWDDLESGDLRAAVLDAWTAVRDPEAQLDAETWAGLFDGAGYQVDGTPADKEDDLDDLLDDLLDDAVLTLYRAASTPAGLSWTPDLATARVRGPRVWRLRIGPEYVLARLTSPLDGSTELVVDTTDTDDGDYTAVRG